MAYFNMSSYAGWFVQDNTNKDSPGQRATITALCSRAGASRIPLLPRTITIPALACSQPLRVNPSYFRIREQADAWLLSVLKPNSTEEAAELTKLLFPFITCAVLSEVEESFCLVASKFMAWGFEFEDITDDANNGLGSLSEAARRLLNDIDQALLPPAAAIKTAKYTVPDHAAAPHINILQDRYRSAAAIDVSLAWWDEMCAYMSPVYQPRFRHNLHLYTAGAATQAAWRQEDIIPDLYTYIAHRRNTVALNPFFTLLECGLGVEFDESVLDCHLLTQLRSAASDHAAWVNDTLSFKRELHQGDFCNLLSVLWRQPSSPGYGDMQKSVDMASKMIKQRDQDFKTLLMQAQGCSTLMDKPGMAKYLRGIADWLPGNLHWTYATTRYYDGVNLANPRVVDSPLTIYLD